MKDFFEYRGFWSHMAKAVGVFVVAMVVIVGLAPAKANAANISVETRQDGSGTYIYYTGRTESWDLVGLKKAYDEAMLASQEEGALPFLNVIVMNGPGGNGKASIDLAHFISEKGLTTVANGGCYSACSLMWLAGGMSNRYLYGDDALIGFHFAYLSDAGPLNHMREMRGWIGVQDEVTRNTHYFTAHLLHYGVNDPAKFVYLLSQYGSSSTFYNITKDNLWESVGGLVYYNNN